MSNLGWPVKVVAKGGIPVTEAANGLGTPYVEADNGVAVTFVESGGYPLTTGGASRFAPYRAPVGWRWDFVREGGSIVTEDNQPVVELTRAA